MSIKKITNEELEILKNKNSLTDDFYYITDFGVLVKRESSYVCRRVNNVIMVRTEQERQYNVARESGKYYYIVQENNIWLFNLSNRWEWIDGDDYPTTLDEDPKMLGSKFYFTTEWFSSDDNNTVYWKLEKNGNIVTGYAYNREALQPNYTKLLTMPEQMLSNNDVYITIINTDGTLYPCKITRGTGFCAGLQESGVNSINIGSTFTYLIVD